MEIKTPESISLAEKTVIVRGDLDADFGGEQNPRLSAVKKTLEYILQNGKGKVILIGHKGRPKDHFAKDLTLLPLASYLKNAFEQDVFFLSHEVFSSYANSDFENEDKRIYLVENLRFWPGEKENEKDFAQKIIEIFRPAVFVNEAFAVSHRVQASVNALPKMIKENGGENVFGFRFAEEVKSLSKVFRDAKSPIVILLGGKKKDKLDYLEPLKDKADKILIGGRLPDYIEMENINALPKEKIIVANLIPDKEDITVRSIEKFEEEIKKASILVFAGPMGKFEDEGHRLGTERVLMAVKSSSAFKVAGGGDSEKALQLLDAKDAFDWVSVGGGAMLEFLAKDTLPGLQAVLE